MYTCASNNLLAKLGNSNLFFINYNVAVYLTPVCLLTTYVTSHKLQQSGFGGKPKCVLIVSLLL